MNHWSVTKNDAMMIGLGRTSVFFVLMTCRSFISGLAKKKTPTEQQSRPKMWHRWHESIKKSCDKISHRLVSMPVSRLARLYCKRLRRRSWGAPTVAGATSAACSQWISNTWCSTSWTGTHQLSSQESQSFRLSTFRSAARGCSWAGPTWTAGNSSGTAVE